MAARSGLSKQRPVDGGRFRVAMPPARCSGLSAGRSGRRSPENHVNRRLHPLVLAMGLALSSAAASTPVQAPAADAPTDEARRYFTEDPDAPMIAPKGYDITIVEYLDYQCPSCRATYKPLNQLLTKDKKVRVIFRDWPIFGDASAHAALVAIASKYQGKYVAVHDALFDTPRPLDDKKIEAAARKAGVDWDRLQKDIVAHSEDIEDLLARNDQQAQLLGLDGTPGFIIGDVQSFGGMTLKQLEDAVDKARKKAAEPASADKPAK